MSVFELNSENFLVLTFSDYNSFMRSFAKMNEMVNEYGNPLIEDRRSALELKKIREFVNKVQKGARSKKELISFLNRSNIDCKAKEIILKHLNLYAPANGKFKTIEKADIISRLFNLFSITTTLTPKINQIDWADHAPTTSKTIFIKKVMKEFLISFENEFVARDYLENECILSDLHYHAYFNGDGAIRKKSVVVRNVTNFLVRNLTPYDDAFFSFIRGTRDANLFPDFNAQEKLIAGCYDGLAKSFQAKLIPATELVGYFYF